MEPIDKLRSAIRVASIHIDAAEVLAIADEIICWNAKWTFRPDPFKSLTEDELKQVKPLRKQEIEDALTVGKIEAEWTRGHRPYINKNRALAKLRHIISLQLDLDGGQVKTVLDELIVELIMGA